MGYAPPTQLSIDKGAGVLNFNAPSGFSRQVPLQDWNNYVSRLAAPYSNASTIDPLDPSTFPAGWGGINQMASGFAENQGFSDEYNINQDRFIQGQSGGGLGRFLRGAAPIAAAGAGLAFAPAIAGAFGGAAGGTAASGGTLGSILSGFSAPQALSGAAIGGLGGFASGGDLSSALKGAGLGGLGGGFGSSLGGALGLQGAGQTAFRGALTGASGGLASGDYRNALIGAGLGGIGGYISGGGSIPGLGNTAGASLDQVTGIEGMQGATRGSGFLGGLTDAASSGLSFGGQPMKLGSLFSGAGDVYGYMQGRDDYEDIANIYNDAAGRVEQQFQPYAQAGQTALGNLMGDPSEMLRSDPGYQFRMQQGNQALERSLAAQGLGQSGAALKAAQEYGQGLADQTYQDYFNRQSQIAGRGMNAASGLGSLYAVQGDALADARQGQMNLRNQALSNLFGGGYSPQGDILEGSLSRLLGGLF